MDNYITLTELGKIYGVAPQYVGRWLKNLGLREENGWPSREAQDQKLVRDVPLDYGGCFWLWHEEKTCKELDMMGYARRGESLGKVVEFDGATLIRGGP